MMFRPIALGLLSMTAACTAALAHTHHDPDFYSQSWNQSFLFTQQQDQKNVFDDDWKDVVSDTHLPIEVRNLCASNPRQCDQWEDWAESVGIWKDPGDSNPLPAPEVDPAGAMGALTILGAVLLMVRGRRPADKPV
jgi:hypothetical protein